VAAQALIDRGDGVRLAYALERGRAPTVVFLPGYLSDMGGTKAQHLAGWGRARGQAVLRLDYSGCGASEGDFAQGSIRRWAADAAAVLTAAAPDGPLILVGSSMGGWIMLHLALMLPSRLAGLVGVAAAPDFTRWGLRLTEADRARLAEAGHVARPSPYGPEPTRYHAAFLADAESACLLDRPIPVPVPVRLIHGMADEVVPWGVSLRLLEALESPDARLLLVKGGDHRLSAPAHLALLTRTVEELLGEDQ